MESLSQFFFKNIVNHFSHSLSICKNQSLSVLIELSEPPRPSVARSVRQGTWVPEAPWRGEHPAARTPSVAAGSTRVHCVSPGPGDCTTAASLCQAQAQVSVTRFGPNKLLPKEAQSPQERSDCGKRGDQAEPRSEPWAARGIRRSDWWDWSEMRFLRQRDGYSTIEVWL